MEILIDFEHPSCFGSVDGMVVAAASGGIPPYSFLWNDSFSDSLLSDLSAGLYQLELTDANGCTEQREILLESPDSLSLLAKVTHASSAETADGTIQIAEITGGTPPYSYLWNTGADTPNLDNLEPGTYMLTLKDSRGCKKDYTFEVSFQTAVKNELSEQFEAFIYPNPYHQSKGAYLEIHALSGTKFHFQLFDISGRLLKEKPLNMIRQKMVFPLLPPQNKGVYFIRLSAENGANKVLKWGVM
ncbi:MAG: T9SS type A sorting domain-containing protein [Bacteroidetes bacterium]|nr:T9SS type A sorting domain-containing protein [Bacteroidota bacterium]